MDIRPSQTYHLYFTWSVKNDRWNIYLTPETTVQYDLDQNESSENCRWPHIKAHYKRGIQLSLSYFYCCLWIIHCNEQWIPLIFNWILLINETHVLKLYHWYFTLQNFFIEYYEILPIFPLTKISQDATGVQPNSNCLYQFIRL